MKLTKYIEKKQFDPDTGKPTKPKLVKQESVVLCDLTGKEIDLEDPDQSPMYWLSFEYDHGSEPSWYYDHGLEEEFGFEYGDISEFFDSPYHFFGNGGCGADVTSQICHVWILAIKNEPLPKNADPEFKALYNEFKKCNSIEQVFRAVRLNTLRRLLREKKYTPQEFGFEEYDKNKFNKE